MMNVNENKELKGTEALEGFVQNTVQMPEGQTFKDEFEKLAGNAINPLGEMQGLVFNPVVDFQNAEDFEIYEINTKEIQNVDAMFFLNAAANSQTINLQMNNETSVIDAANYKTMEVSKTLGDMLIKASENNKSLRLDFDNQVTVVLKVSKEGKIDTTFFPRDKEVENYLKNNIDYLKLRFDEQNIAYSNISYRPYREPNKQNQKDNNNNNQGEKSHE